MGPELIIVFASVDDLACLGSALWSSGYPHCMVIIIPILGMVAELVHVPARLQAPN